MRTLLILICFVFAPAVQAEDVLKGRLGVFTFPDSEWWNQWMRFKDRIDANPEIELEYYLSGELGSEQNLVNATRRNRVQIISVTGQGIASLVPAYNVVMTPFLFDSYEEADFVFDNYLAEPVQQMLADQGLVVLRWIETGWTILYSKEKQIRTPADMNGLTFRIAPNSFGEAFMRSLNADFAALDLADLTPGLQTGLLDGGVTNVVFLSNQLTDLVSHATETNHTYESGAVLASKRWFDGATSSQQDALIAAYDTLEDLRRGTRSYVNGMIEKGSSQGLTYYSPTAEERTLWRAETADAIDLILDVAGPEGQRLWDLIQQGKQDYADRKS